jgi:8-amino-7-oxononanoate synthase
MIELEERLEELADLGLRRRMRMVSGPQGAHVLLDGKPVLLLCSGNYLGFADHPRVRDAAADAARRWGIGAGGSRLGCGTMTVHRRLEERLATFAGREAALLFGSGYLAHAGVVAALARPGDVVFCDAHSHPSLIDGCRLSRAETFTYEHRDVEHLAWGIARADGRGALVVSESVFCRDGDLAPLEDLVELAAHHNLRTLIDESHAFGTRGPRGRGALADAGLEDEVDVIVGSLGLALGSYGAFAACDGPTARYLVNAARTFIFSAALPPPTVAGALAALDLLEERPHRPERLQTNAEILRRALREEGLDPGAGSSQIIPVWAGEPGPAERWSELALSDGIFCEAVNSPASGMGSPAGGGRWAGAGSRSAAATEPDSCLRLTVMASHREDELRAAAHVLTRTARTAGVPVRDAFALETQQGAAVPLGEKRLPGRPWGVEGEATRRHVDAPAPAGEPAGEAAAAESRLVRARAA